MENCIQVHEWELGWFSEKQVVQPSRTTKMAQIFAPKNHSDCRCFKLTNTFQHQFFAQSFSRKTLVFIQWLLDHDKIIHKKHCASSLVQRALFLASEARAAWVKSSGSETWLVVTVTFTVRSLHPSCLQRHQVSQALVQPYCLSPNTEIKAKKTERCFCNCIIKNIMKGWI